jgi:molybdate transport system substrate-binding protein
MKFFRFKIIVLLICFAKLAPAQKQDKILIAAASDLKFALDSILVNFKKISKGKVNVTYGSSGKLFEQISGGAPFDVFFSADISYPGLLEKKGLTISPIYTYGIGRIVIWSKKMNPQQAGMNSLLSPSIKKIAIANPAHAPYGKRAQESLQYYKLWDRIKDKMVYGENISQTAQFVTTGAADIGIIALSLALSPNMNKEPGSYFLIPSNAYQPLEQGVVLTKKAKENSLAKMFMEYIQSANANAVFKHFGFTKP